MRLAGKWIIAPLLAGLAACSTSQDISAAQAGVTRFHIQLDAGNYAAIWNTGSSEMRAAATQPVMTKFLTAVHDKLGPVKTANTASWNVNYNTGGTYTTLSVHTVFAHGTGDESFVFKQRGGNTQLVGYHINSMDMMMMH